MSTSSRLLSCWIIFLLSKHATVNGNSVDPDQTSLFVSTPVPKNEF